METERLKTLYKSLDGFNKIWTETPKKTESLEWHGVKFEVWRTGTCFWTKIWFIKNGDKIYLLERSNLTGPSGDNYRNEFFNGKKVRTYDGNQPCFFEFSSVLYEYKKEVFPTKADFLLIGQCFKLEADIIQLYSNFYKKIFGKK